MVQEQADLARISVQLQRAFTPAAPVQTRDLLAGRESQIRKVISAVSQVGRHAVIFGERGVGKTSLAGLVHEIWSVDQSDFARLIPARVSCDSNDDYSSTWAKVADDIMLAFDKRGVDWRAVPENGAFQTALAEMEIGNATPSIVRRALDLTGYAFIVVIDEFDRLDDDQGIRMVADTIKMLSDHFVNATLILVGVADTVEELIAEHESIRRSMVQVLVPRMPPPELRELVSGRLSSVGMTIDETTNSFIAKLSQGLPSYAHLLGLTSGLEAVRAGRRDIRMEDVGSGLRSALDMVEESTRSAYHEATLSPHQNNLYKQVLLACALCDVDDLGYFAPAAIRELMSAIMGRPYDTPGYTKHLKDLCTTNRARLLQTNNRDRHPRYRFRDPMMQPYIALRAWDEGRINETWFTQEGDESASS